MSSDLTESEPKYGETIQIFDTEYIYLGRDSTHVQVQHPETEETHQFGFWEFIEGRIHAEGEVL